MIQIEGMGRLRKALLTVTQEGEKTTSRVVASSALNIQRRAKQNLTTNKSVDTGRLRNSIAVAETEAELPETEGIAIAPNQIRAGMLSAVVGTKVFYGPFVEFGTRRSRAKPYLFPAYEEERSQFIQRLQKELGEAFVKIRG